MSERLMADYAIRQLHARFVDAVWRKDAAAFAGTFAPDGEWKIAGLHLRGREEIEATFARLLGACAHVIVNLSPPVLEIGAGEASGRIHATEFTRMMDGAFAMTFGVYHDLYVGRGEDWHFARRHFALQYRGPADMSAEFVTGTDYGPFPNRPAPDAPTFTRRKAD